MDFLNIIKIPIKLINIVIYTVIIAKWYWRTKNEEEK